MQASIRSTRTVLSGGLQDTTWTSRLREVCLLPWRLLDFVLTGQLCFLHFESPKDYPFPAKRKTND